MPIRTGSYCPSGPDVTLALDQVLEGAELPQADRAAGVELLGRVSDLGPHSELASVGEAGGRVHVDARRVHSELKGARLLRVAGDDRLRMPRAPAVDVLDRLVDRADHTHRQGQSVVLGGPVIV